MLCNLPKTTTITARAAVLAVGFQACMAIILLASAIIFHLWHVTGMEMIGPQHRLIVGIVINLFWATGFLLLIAIGYLIRTWKYLHLATSLPTLLFISYYWQVFDSCLVEGVRSLFL